jgi:uncharacterized repeat protein (TIGR01451 family)
MALTKTANSPAARAVGQTITYTITVTNTGGLTLHDVMVTDVLAPPAGPNPAVTCPRTTLGPRESMSCTTSAYTVKQADVDKGGIMNTAHAVGVSPDGASVGTPQRSLAIPTKKGPLAVKGAPVLPVEAQPAGPPLARTGGPTGRGLLAGILIATLGLLMTLAARRGRRQDRL